MTSAHQGWLDTLVEYGVVGVVLVLLVLISTIVRVVQRLNSGDYGTITIVGVGMTVGLIMGTLSESTLVFPGLAIMALTNGLMYNDPLNTEEQV